MKVENRAYASPIYMLFVSQGSRAQCFNERPGPHSNGLKPSAPPHCVASSRNKAVCAFLLVPRPRGCGCDGSLPSTKRIIAASRHFARRVALALVRGLLRNAEQALAGARAEHADMGGENALDGSQLSRILAGAGLTVY